MNIPTIMKTPQDASPSQRASFLAHGPNQALHFKTIDDRAIDMELRARSAAIEFYEILAQRAGYFGDQCPAVSSSPKLAAVRCSRASTSSGGS